MGCEEVADCCGEERDGEGEETKEEFDEGVYERGRPKKDIKESEFSSNRRSSSFQINQGRAGKAKTTRLTIQQLPPTPSVPPRNQSGHSSRTREEGFPCDPDVDERVSVELI